MISTTAAENLVLGFLKIDSTDKTRFLVTDNLNAAQRHLLTILPASMISDAIKTVKGTLAQNVRAYQYPTDLVRALRLWLCYTAPITIANPGYVAREVKDVSTLSSIHQIGTTLYPIVGFDVEGGFEVAPMPTANQTDGFRLRYVYRLPDMSAGQDSVLPAQFTNLLVYYAAMLSASVEMYDPALSQAMAAAFKDELELFLPKVERQE
jgi:hypothetical protein